MGLSRLKRWTLMVPLVLAVACAPAEKSEPPKMTEAQLPTEISGWTAAGEPEHHDTETIYDYIDGHAEVYVAYGLRRSVSQRYAAPGGAEIVVDLFELASPADAYGVFSHDRSGEPATVGNGGVYRSGWLSFWQAQWAGSVYWNGAGEPDREAILAIGLEAASSLPAGGETPDLVRRLPAEGLDPQSVCFLRSPQILNAHVVVGPDNPFGLGPGVEAVVGRYEIDGEPAHLVVVRYPDERAAEGVEAGLRSPAVELAPMTVGRRGRLVAATVGEVPETSGSALLEAALGGEG
jgi:hypothetical protein